MEATMWSDTAFWLGFVNIIIIDIILSGDNAVVIGMAARNLPEHQRKKAILFGAAAAVFLRASLTAVAAYLLNIPFLMSVGGLLLLWIAVKLLVDEEESTQVTAGSSMRSAIKTIVIADVVMSLDNVLAVAGAAHGNLLLILFGLALSIPIIMWGSKLIASIMNRLPWLVYLGSAILGYTAGELILKDPFISGLVPANLRFLDLAVPMALAVLSVLAGFVVRRAIGRQKTA
ncbi:TerC family protein [Staphylospora marina]|uniref:TerC family protein n=1 Tax=Staphylospora marina TaxID=2490858 RepID=UPI000F5BDA8B|nr:TerC family protein [Staphylospora marina]